MSKNMNTTDFAHLASLPTVDWNKMRHFYYVAKIGSFTHAANFIESTQPRLSRQVQLLELELGCKLFTRSFKGVVLTRKGEELLEVVERYFIDLKKFNFNHKAMCRNGEKRRIRIASNHMIGTYILNDHLIEFNKMHPDVIIETVIDDFILDLVINDVDIAVRPRDDKAVGVHQEHLFTMQKKLYASAEYLTRYGEPQNIKDLDRHHFIAVPNPNDFPYADVHWSLKLGMPSGQKRIPSYTSMSGECLIHAAKRGLGIFGTYPELSLVKESNLQQILPEVECEPEHMHILYPNYVHEDDILVKLADYLKTKFNKN